MNKILIIIGLWLAAGTFSSCEKPDVGYLITESAEYPIDSLVIMTLPRLEQEIADLKYQKEHFEQTDEGKALLKKKQDLENELAEVEKEMAVLAAKRDELDDAMYEITNEESDEYKRLAAEREEVHQAWKALDRGAKSDLIQEIQAVNKELGSAAVIDEKIAVIQRRIAKKIPYTTSAMDGVLGTEPMNYRITGVSSTDGDAAAFSKCLSVMGGGRLVVDWGDNELPLGRYEISTEVSNEGYTVQFSKVFTFVVI